MKFPKVVKWLNEKSSCTWGQSILAKIVSRTKYNFLFYKNISQFEKLLLPFLYSFLESHIFLLDEHFSTMGTHKIVRNKDIFIMGIV